MATGREFSVGEQRVSERDGTIVLSMRGMLSGEDARALVAAIEGWLPADRPLYGIIDGAHLDGVTPEGRKAFAQWTQRRTAPDYVAAVGLNFTASTMLFLLGNASRLMGRGPEIKTFDDEKAARAWLAAHGSPTTTT